MLKSAISDVSCRQFCLSTKRIIIKNFDRLLLKLVFCVMVWYIMLDVIVRLLCLHIYHVHSVVIAHI